MTICLRAVLAGLAILLLPAPGYSQSPPATEAESPDLELSANVAVVSDYRFRGISLSNRKAAAQAGVDLQGKHFFVGAWASTISEYEGADVEIDVYAGLQGYSESFGWTAGAYAYTYPNGANVNYVDLIATAETYLGPATFGVEASYAPPQDNVEVENKYLGASAAYDLGAGFEVTARGGFEDGFYDGKWDWEIGAKYQVGPLTAALSYVATNFSGVDEAGYAAGGSVVASLLATF